MVKLLMLLPTAADITAYQACPFLVATSLVAASLEAASLAAASLAATSPAAALLACLSKAAFLGFTHPAPMAAL